MTNEPTEPLRGDAAWRAAKQRVADANEQAFKRGREERAARLEVVKERERVAARREWAEMPEQPS